MRLTQHSKNELKFANTNIKKEYGFGVVVLLAFVGLIIAGPWYFGDELNWFMYGLFIIASIVAAFLSLPEEETFTISKMTGDAVLEKKRMFTNTTTRYVKKLSSIESVGLQRVKTYGSGEMTRVVLYCDDGVVSFPTSSFYFRRKERELKNHAKLIEKFLDVPYVDIEEDDE